MLFGSICCTSSHEETCAPLAPANVDRHSPASCPLKNPQPVEVTTTTTISLTFAGRGIGIWRHNAPLIFNTFLDFLQCGDEGCEVSCSLRWMLRFTLEAPAQEAADRVANQKQRVDGETLLATSS